MAGTLPVHIAIIMDGNGRWATQRSLPRIEGHRKGVEAVHHIVQNAAEIGIRYLTLYAFSQENWQRSQQEVDFLMGLLSEYIDNELEKICKNNIRLNVIGRLHDLPRELAQKIQESIDKTRSNKGMVLTLALSYSARSEIVEAVRVIASKVRKGKLDPAAIDEKLVSSHLQTHDLPDPDLLIRTSGELRVSNFLLWQISYTEFYVTDKLWPDFDKADLLKAIEAFKRRERRFGKTEAAH